MTEKKDWKKIGKTSLGRGKAFEYRVAKYIDGLHDWHAKRIILSGHLRARTQMKVDEGDIVAWKEGDSTTYYFEAKKSGSDTVVLKKEWLDMVDESHFVVFGFHQSKIYIVVNGVNKKTLKRPVSKLTNCAFQGGEKQVTIHRDLIPPALITLKGVRCWTIHELEWWIDQI